VGELVRAVLDRAQVKASAPSRSTVQVFEAFHRLGPPLTRQCEPVSYRYGALTLRVFGAAWMTELSFLEGEVRQKLNRLLGRERVKRVRFVAGRPRALPPPAGPPRLTDAQLAKVEAWGAMVERPELRAALMRAAARAIGRPPDVPSEPPDIRRGTNLPRTRFGK
jgi:hypothetical protein